MKAIAQLALGAAVSLISACDSRWTKKIAEHSVIYNGVELRDAEATNAAIELLITANLDLTRWRLDPDYRANKYGNDYLLMEGENRGVIRFKDHANGDYLFVDLELDTNAGTINVWILPKK
jgi:hypothetical protein